jgi:SAM-dependent methyltransferase
MANTTETFQMPIEAVEAYESVFVPMLFAPWAAMLVAEADVATGHRVLDVGCGTGIVARLAAERAGPSGSVVGLDLNEAMLQVARRLRPDLEWRSGDAGDLPFVDDLFDVVFCQAALMFFPDATAALREMGRVVRPDGEVAVQVWDRQSDQPAYHPFIEIAARHAGHDAVSLLRSYFVRGDLGELAGSFENAGLDVTGTRTETTTMRFASVEQLVEIEVRGTPLGQRLREDVIHRIVDDARDVLSSFFTPEGELDVPIRGHLIRARPR